MSNHSIIEHRANYHFVKVEEDYIAICLKGKASPHCKALILAILEQWTNTKRDQGEEPVIYMTYPQWIKATYWYHGRNVIIDSLQELEDIGFITRHPYRIYGKDTFAYVLNIETIQKHIKQLPEKASGDNLPSFNLNAFKNKRVPNQTRPKSNGNDIYNQTADAFNNERNIDTTTQLPNTTSEEGINTFANAESVALHTQPINFEERKRKTDPHHPAVHLTIETPYHIATDGYEKDDDEEPTEKLAAVKIGGNDATNRPSTRIDNRVALRVATSNPHETPGYQNRTKAAQQQEIASQQTPDAGTRSGPASPPRGSRPDVEGSVQAKSPGDVTPARRSGNADSLPPISTGAAQGGRDHLNGASKVIPKRPRKAAKVTQAKEPAFTLTEQQQAFWTLWCAVWFNVDIPPVLNETAYKHVVKLAPYITTQEQMNSLEKHARKRLLEQSGISRKEVQLGNCANSYQSWKQTQQREPKPKDGPILGSYYLLGEAM